MITRHTKIKLRQLGTILIAWVICGVFITIYDHILIQTQVSAGPSEIYSFTEMLLRNTIAGFVGAMIGGSFMVFYVNVKYPDKPYWYTIVSVVAFLILIVSLVTLIIALILIPMRTGYSIFNPVSRQAFMAFISDGYPLKSFLVWLMIVTVTQLAVQINSKFGYGAFWNILRGKYQTPVTENRIFMFLDINQSTSIAEKLGNELYHSLLKDFYRDITNPILDCAGNIYQYVGDEVVISWKMNEASGDNSVTCFFKLKNLIDTRKEVYLAKYGVVPTFKAGLHCGQVVVGEVGIVKRDITYSGDVLNTTSRIQALCKEYEVDFISSSLVVEQLTNHKLFQLNDLGLLKLRGKTSEVSLVSISMNSGRYSEV